MKWVAGTMGEENLGRTLHQGCFRLANALVARKWPVFADRAVNCINTGDFTMEGLAERVGFEPTVEFPRHSLSRRALSTAQTPLRGCCTSSLANALQGHN